MEPQTVAACRVASRKYGVPVSIILAVVETESNGVTYAKVAGRSEPLIRWEGHYFDQRLNGAKREEARRLGLASPRAGGVKNPAGQAARWDQLYIPAARIDAEAATESISMGVGQVMGAHDSKLGFKSAVEMFKYCRLGVTEQVDIMMRYCQKFNLIDELQRADFAGFARGYNGPSYKKYSYDSKMRTAAKRYTNLDDAEANAEGISVAKPARAIRAEGMLRMGTEGARVREAQALLNRAAVKCGFGTVIIDGDFGPSTKAAVKEFQRCVELEVDGIIGPVTWKKLETFKVDPAETPGVPGPAEAVVQTPEGRQGAVTALSAGTLTATLSSAQEALTPLTGTGGIIDSVYVVLTVAGVLVTLGGVAWAIYGWHRANTTRGVEA